MKVSRNQGKVFGPRVESHRKVLFSQLLSEDIVAKCQIIIAARLGRGARNPQEYDESMDYASRLTKDVWEEIAAIISKELYGTTCPR